ncbi:DUF4367 domain-containing protein [Fictibacillus aquaticus]|uniref:Anti-sigma factor n=1 Tax=Fictibacillus aquaticus TaxID=2021314 RepID=A0A235F6Q9_9BACL|nr:DUF4367 domain-containing protein [Fictibacillus aquaticus]OYD56753.1 anti-sigma factor [Fictibacillus aquaticus]
MNYSKSSEIMDEVAEKIALEDFDKVADHHTFSDTYKHKKKMFLKEIQSKGGQPQVKRKKNCLLIAAACLLIGIPTTAFGAAKVYDMFVQKENYEVNVSVTNDAAKNKNSWYKLKLNHMPENMAAIDETAMKYSFKDNFANGGFSFILWRLGKDSDFQTLYSNSYEELEMNGRKAVIVNKDNGNDNLSFNRQVFLLFEKEGFMLESYIGTDVSEEQMIDVLENISLETASKETASQTIDYDEAQSIPKDKPIETKVIPLKNDSPQLFSVGQSVPVTINLGESLSKLEYVVEKVKVFDSLQDFKQENFNPLGLKILHESKAINETKTLLPYKRDVFKAGDGKDSIDELIETKFVNVKFVHLTTTIKNTGKKATEEIYMHPSLKVLRQSENNAWIYAGKKGIAEESIMTGEVDYLEPHGNGKSFYNIGSIAPGQTIKVSLGYFVDEDKLNSIFLDAFHYCGFGNIEDMNKKDRWWIDIRQ